MNKAEFKAAGERLSQRTLTRAEEMRQKAEANKEDKVVCKEFLEAAEEALVLQELIRMCVKYAKMAGAIPADADEDKIFN